MKNIFTYIWLTFLLMTPINAALTPDTPQKLLLKHDSLLREKDEIPLNTALYYYVLDKSGVGFFPISAQTESTLRYLSDRIYYLENKPIISFFKFVPDKVVDFLPVQLQKRIR